MPRTAQGRSKASSRVKADAVNAKSRELRAFLFLTIILAPAVAVAVVGGYGFSIWMYQLIAGPPGAP